MSPRVMIIHADAPIVDLTGLVGQNIHAHCFGPFNSREEAEAFNDQRDDDCWKWMLDIVGPEAIDIALTMPDMNS